MLPVVTITAWIKSDNTSGPRTIVTKWNDNTGEWSYIFKDHNDNDKLRMSLSQGAWLDLADLSGTTSISLDQWTFVATTFDSSFLKLYFNGVEDASMSVSGTINNSSTELLIGAAFSLGGINEHFDGTLDDIRMYNRALSSGEITELYNEPNPVPEPTTIALLCIGLVGFAGTAIRRKLKKSKQ